MDSADEKPELPSSIQDLVMRLEGQGEPITQLPALSGPEFLDFFPERALLSTIKGWRIQVRSRVLEAISNCNTLEILDVHDICEGDLSRLEAREWEVVLKGFSSSTLLKKISLEYLMWSSDAEVESLCLQLGKVLNSSSVTELTIARCRINARCFLNLASGLGVNCESKLECLELWDAWKDSSALKHVADMINGAPLLETLRLGGYHNDMEDETVGILSQALIQSSSLRELVLKGVETGAALLLRALAGEDRNQSVERLRLWHMDRLGDCLRELLSSNPSLKELELYRLYMSPEEWHQLGKVIRDNVVATSILVKFDFDFTDDWESIEALAGSASSDVKEPTLELELETSSDHEVISSLNLLGRVLRGEIKSIKSLSILADLTKIITFSILPINGKTGETSVLKRWELSLRSEDHWKGVWEELLRCMRGNHLTHLDLSDSELDEVAFRDLMGLLQVNLALQEIDVSRTSWARDGKAAQIQEAVKQNQKRAVYMSVFREANLTFGDAKAGRLFLCGSPRADPNWLTNTFLGELIALGQDFQAQESQPSDRMRSYASKDGFVSESVFAELIEEFLRQQPHIRVLNREVLEKILITLDLCFKLEDTSQYFIPSFIPEHASMEEHEQQEGGHAESMYWENRCETSQFVGIRIQCQDGRTMSLTAAFFPRFQMFMRRKLIYEMHVSEKNVTCCRHYLRLFLDGHEIYIEHVQSEKSHKYVDVLMLCSSHQSREMATKYVMKHIVQELISFCASPKGCPGVALVLGVIQTFCVEMLIPSHLRGAILIEELKLDFIRGINDKLEEMPLDGSHLMEKKKFFHYEHCWPPIEGHKGRISERVGDLLWESDVEEVVNKIRQTRIGVLKSLHEGLISVENDLAHSNLEAEYMVSNSHFPQMKDCKPPTSRSLSRASTCKPPSSRYLSRASTSVENRSTQLVLFKIDQLEEKLVQKVDGLDERLRSVQDILWRLEMKMGQILSLHQELQSTMTDFVSKVDRIIQYSNPLQQTRMPKRPYVTNDVGRFYKISAELHSGTTVCLRLMCESMTGFHIVEDQEGLKIRLDLENSSSISQIINISYKVMYYSMKAGLDFLFRLGQAIPEWEDLKSDIVQLDSISDDDRRALLKGGESKELQVAWLRIQQILAPQLQNRYSEIFQLYQVKYVNLEKARFPSLDSSDLASDLKRGQALGLSGNKRPIGGNICLDGLAKDSVIAAVVSTEDSSLQINVFVIDSEIHFHGAQTGKANAVLVVN
ncbi:hypothetical protein AXG93_2549s1000 [Marchantia polymorpha subsp. ruderalis]|uniref:Uncharacterized protein n=1 Tax=Marchantia polymorpha subsp. ruderalis TaxID=1480154 RepID=A0A176W197_MARPO|nr:hypothetical protein AXG93_2549s1000 [Marchantia polymorpha subsp. ruderalis]